MTYWSQKLPKYFRVGPYGLTATAIITLSVLFRTILVMFHFPEVNSDEGKMALAGMHIAFLGQHPIYDYGQDYLGVLEAYIAAPFFRLFGVSDITLRIGMLIMFALFMIVMYWLASLLYSKRLALVTVFLLSFATTDMLIQQLRAIGGAMELILFGALMMVLAYHLAATAGTRKRWRYLIYFAWGWTAGIALWVHILVLPFVVCSGLLILVFCYREWRTLAIPCLLAGFLLGGFLLIPGYSAIPHALTFQSGASVLAGSTPSEVAHLLRKQFISTFLWGIPLTTWIQPICTVYDLPYYGPHTPLTIPCSALQGTWGIGYVLLLGTGIVLASSAFWKLRKQQHDQGQAFSLEVQQETARQFARLMLLLVAVLIIFLYLRSPLSGLKPWSTRYLVGLLVATPAILWPLWRLTGLENASPMPRWTAQWLSRTALVLVIVVALFSTIWTVTTVPAAYADEQQQMQLVNDLLKLKLTRVYLEYWTCYRLLFQSQEQILCARPPYPYTIGADDYLPDARAVQPNPNVINPKVPFLFPATSTGEIAAFEAYNKAHGKHFQKYTLDGMVLYIPIPTG
jgi:4-amino-4-deoxy-L-arabinose transferase-like glycosyltransferase